MRATVLRTMVTLSAAVAFHCPAPASAADLGAAERCSPADAYTAQAHDGDRGLHEAADAAVESEAARGLSRLVATIGTRVDGGGEPRGAGDREPRRGPDAVALGAALLGFRDAGAPRERLRDLRALRELKLLRLLDTSSTMVWLGLDRKGRPGLHFRQRERGEELPVATSAALFDAPPLRTVALTSP